MKFYFKKLFAFLLILFISCRSHNESTTLSPEKLLIHELRIEKMKVFFENKMTNQKPTVSYMWDGTYYPPALIKVS